MQNISVHSAQFLLIIVIINDLRTFCTQLKNNIIYVPVQLFWLAETSVYNYISLRKIFLGKDRLYFGRKCRIFKINHSGCMRDTL